MNLIESKNNEDTAKIVDMDVISYSLMLMSLIMKSFFGSSVLILFCLEFSNIFHHLFFVFS